MGRKCQEEYVQNRRKDVPLGRRWAVERNNHCRAAATAFTRSSALSRSSLFRLRSAYIGRANGLEVHLRGQGPRGYGRGGGGRERWEGGLVRRGWPPPPRRSDLDFTRRLGRRTEAGPRQVLARVRRRPPP